jgi:hypothetical protein
MNTKFADKVLRMIFIFVFVMGTVWMPNTSAGAQEPNPFFIVRFNENLVESFNWTKGVPITLTIDDPSTSEPADYTQTITFPLEYSNKFRFDLGNFIIQPDFIITMTDGTITRTHTVINLKVDGVDTETDTVFGKAEPSTFVHVFACDESGCGNVGALRHVFSDETGNWVANFASPGFGDDEQSLFDIKVGKRGEAFQFEYGDVNSTSWSWSVSNPSITAYTAENIVKGEDLTQGAQVTLTIDDPTNGIGTDVALEGIADQTGGRCTGWCVEFKMPDGFQLAGGQVITLDDGTTNISYTVSNLKLVHIDIQNDTISGTADPFSTVDLVMWFRDSQRRVTANTNGNWIADFSVPGTDPFDRGTCDFSADPLCAGMASQYDGNNRVRIDWNLPPAPNPFIIVQPNEDRVFALGWSMGTVLQVEIDDPTTLQIPDYSDSLLVTGSGNWENGLNLNGIFDIQPDHVVTVSDGTTIRQHTVTISQ